MNPSYVGKVRDIYEHGNALILCSTDRVSAFDIVFKQNIPEKGKVLNRVSNLWFHYFSDVKNHILETEFDKFPKPYNKNNFFKGRSVLVKKCRRIDYECVVRGYLSGSAYKEYQKFGTIAERPFPPGIQQSAKLSEPIFTPAVKNDTGHDENISEREMQNRIGSEVFQKLKDLSLYLYEKAAETLVTEGLILCDTKIEFGYYDGEIIVIDELLTPDCSRYWDIADYQTGISPPSMDKQILRNYLESIQWDKNPPPPELPAEIIQKISQKYQILEQRIQKCISEKSA